ncbi:MAG TPA: hypothetical protein VLY23_02490 [Candidatus Acidoferrum sp.]|nr:hypothetical protein [Candidatus Acidoferrum sp.]
MKMTRSLALILFAFLSFLGSAAIAHADTVYSYTGSDFATWTNTSCPPVCHITGSLTLAAPLLPGLNFTDVTPLSFSFTDGITTLTNVNAPNFIIEFSTDPTTGAITFWDLSLGHNEDPSQCPPGTSDLRFMHFESTSTFSLNDVSAVCATATTGNLVYEADNETSGVWMVSTTGGTSAPEPGALSLTLLGLLAAAISAASSRPVYLRRRT